MSANNRGLKVVAVVSERGLKRLAESEAHCVRAYANVVDEDDCELVRLSDTKAALGEKQAWYDRREAEAHDLSEQIIKLRGLNAELVEALRELEDVASFTGIEDRQERRDMSTALAKARAALAKAAA